MVHARAASSSRPVMGSLVSPYLLASSNLARRAASSSGRAAGVSGDDGL